MKYFFLLAIFIPLTACVSSVDQVSAVRNRAAYDLNCNPQKLEIVWLQPSTYGAEGCKGKQVYTVQGTMVYKEGAAPNPVYIESPVYYGNAGIYRFR